MGLSCHFSNIMAARLSYDIGPLQDEEVDNDLEENVSEQDKMKKTFF